MIRRIVRHKYIPDRLFEVVDFDRRLDKVVLYSVSEEDVITTTFKIFLELFETVRSY